MKVGDKVSFINEKLNGIIKNIKPDGYISVEIESGFEIDTTAKEIIVTQVFIAERSDSSPEIKPEIVSQINFNLSTDEINLAAVPAEKNRVLTGNIYFYLVNGSDFDLHCLFYSKSDTQTELVLSQTLSSHSHALVLTVNRNELTDISSFYIQLLLSGNNHIHPPVQKEIPLLLPDLSLKHKNFPDYSSVVSIANFKEVDEAELMLLMGKFTPDDKSLSVPHKFKKKKSQQTTGAVLQNSKEVDLHIEKLTSDYRSMSNAEMLELQKAKVRDEMENAIVNHFKKIIFIHGKGEGVLKKEVLKELSAYTGITVREGDYFRYGGGATEVLF